MKKILEIYFFQKKTKKKFGNLIFLKNWKKIIFPKIKN